MAYNKQCLKRAIKEAKRFLAKAEAKEAGDTSLTGDFRPETDAESSVKRSSMDLTRALADLRNNQRETPRP